MIKRCGRVSGWNVRRQLRVAMSLSQQRRVSSSDWRMHLRSRVARRSVRPTYVESRCYAAYRAYKLRYVSIFGFYVRTHYNRHPVTWSMGISIQGAPPQKKKYSTFCSQILHTPCRTQILAIHGIIRFGDELYLTFGMIKPITYRVTPKIGTFCMACNFVKY